MSYQVSTRQVGTKIEYTLHRDDGTRITIMGATAEEVLGWVAKQDAQAASVILKECAARILKHALPPPGAAMEVSARFVNDAVALANFVAGVKESPKLSGHVADRSKHSADPLTWERRFSTRFARYERLNPETGDWIDEGEWGKICGQ